MQQELEKFLESIEKEQIQREVDQFLSLFPDTPKGDKNNLPPPN